jgi:hypothetical protein
VVYSLFSYHQKNLGGPGSSRGTLERIRAGLTVFRVIKNIIINLYRKLPESDIMSLWAIH